MQYALMELFQMHHSDTRYGVECTDRMSLFRKAHELGFDGIEFGLTLNYAQDPLWTGSRTYHQAMREAAARTGVEARSSVCTCSIIKSIVPRARIRTTDRQRGISSNKPLSPAMRSASPSSSFLSLGRQRCAHLSEWSF